VVLELLEQGDSDKSDDDNEGDDDDDDDDMDDEELTGLAAKCRFVASLVNCMLISLLS
jgi:hypothetical protein